MSSEALDKRFKDLQDRLAALHDATGQLRELIDRLASFNFQPGSLPLATGDGDEDENVVSELGTEINQILREQEEDLELLREEVADVRPVRKPATATATATAAAAADMAHDKERLRDGLERLGQELKRCRSYFRKAQIAAKRNLEQAQRQERELLYASFSSPRSGASSPPASADPSTTAATTDSQGQGQAQPQLQLQTRRRGGHHYKSAEASREDRLVGASHDVTQSLRQTHDLMASELSRSEFAHRTLRESTRALAELSESYSGLDGLLQTSRDLLGSLFRSQKSDTWYLETSFYLLLATVLWLVFRRWLYGPLWWLLWLPLKLVFRAAVGVSSSVGRSAGSPADSSAAIAGFQQSSILQQATMNNEGAPTIQVSQQTAAEPTPSSGSGGSGDGGSVVDEVGNIIDHSQSGAPAEAGQDGVGAGSSDAQAGSQGQGQEQGQGQGQGGDTVLRERRADEPPNPRKRMMVEEAPGGGDAGQQGKPKDEL